MSQIQLLHLCVMNRQFCFSTMIITKIFANHLHNEFHNRPIEFNVTIFHNEISDHVGTSFRNSSNPSTNHSYKKHIFSSKKSSPHLLLSFSFYFQIITYLIIPHNTFTLWTIPSVSTIKVKTSSHQMLLKLGIHTKTGLTKNFLIAF